MKRKEELLRVGVRCSCQHQCNEFLKSYRLHNTEWGIDGEKKYISAYDAIAYPQMSIEKVEEIVTKKEGNTVLSGNSGCVL